MENDPPKMPLVVPSFPLLYSTCIRRVNVVGVIDGFHAPLFILTLWLTPSCKWVSRSPTRSPFCLSTVWCPPLYYMGHARGPLGTRHKMHTQLHYAFIRKNNTMQNMTYIVLPHIYISCTCTVVLSHVIIIFQNSLVDRHKVCKS